MKKYVYLFGGDYLVAEIVDEINPIFPDFPIEQRYSAEFLSHCLVFTEEEFNHLNISLGMKYNPETKEFYMEETPFIEFTEEERTMTREELLLRDSLNNNIEFVKE